MLETIPAIYWMIIVAIPVGFLTFILFQLGMLIKDSRGVITESKETISKANVILDDVQEMITTTKSTVNEINETVIQPVRGIAGTVSTITGFVNGLKK